MTTATATRETHQPLARWQRIVFASVILIAPALIVAFGVVPLFTSDDTPAAPTWANQVLTVSDNPATEAVVSGYSVRSVLYVDDMRAGDVAFAVNNLMGSAGLRANDGGNVLLLIVTGQTEQAARAEAQRWQAAVLELLSGWRAQ